MIAIVTNATHAPIHAQRGPINCTKAPIGPVRVCRPTPNSTMISGIDHSSRNTAQATRNSPPPFCAAIRGNRQMFPVPTAMPSMASNISQRDENASRCSLTPPPVAGRWSHHTGRTSDRQYHAAASGCRHAGWTHSSPWSSRTVARSRESGQATVWYPTGRTSSTAPGRRLDLHSHVRASAALAPDLPGPRIPRRARQAVHRSPGEVRGSPPEWLWSRRPPRRRARGGTTGSRP